MPQEDEPEHATEISGPPSVKKRAPTTYIGTVVGGRYRIVGPIGRGGAGNVYRGLQEPLNREVAVKILRPDLSEDSKVEWQARFLREAALAGRLSHPNVITVHDYGVMPDGASFVVMEFVKGRVMSDMIAKGTALDPARAANLACQVARGLRAVHDAELIHRDVKPHNVMVIEEDGRERAVLLDFGLVKVADMVDSDMDTYQTRAGTYMGTPAYMAPEQAKGGKVDHRVDLYALGCMMFRLLSGQIPFQAEHPLGMAVQHMTEPVPAFRDIAPEKEIPARLEKIVRRLMEKDPDRRYRSAGDLVSELEKFLEDPPLPRAPPPKVTGAVGAGMGAVGASLGLLGVAFAVVAIFVALIVVLLFAQQQGDHTVEPAIPLPALPVPVEPTLSPPAPVLPSPEPVLSSPKPSLPSPEPVLSSPGPARPTPTPSPIAPVPPNPKPSEPVPNPKPAVPPSPTSSSGPAPQSMPGIPAPGEAPDPVVPAPVVPAAVVPAAVVPAAVVPAAVVSAPVVPAGAPRAFNGGTDVFVDEVGFSTASAARALTFVNTATPEQLAAVGVYRKGVQIIIAQRPFASLKAFGGTYGIGKKTMRSVRDAK